MLICMDTLERKVFLCMDAMMKLIQEHLEKFLTLCLSLIKTLCLMSVIFRYKRIRRELLESVYGKNCKFQIFLQWRHRFVDQRKETITFQLKTLSLLEEIFAK